MVAARHPAPLETKTTAAPPERGVDLTLSWEAKLASADQRTIEGHAAVTGNLDLNGDVILPGAFGGTVAAGPGAVKVLIGHDYNSLPVGRTVELKEDARGLFVKARILETSAGNDLLEVVKDAHDHGESVGMSIGYRVTEYAWAERDMGRNGGKQLVREIKALEVKEFSFVTFPANPKAVTTGVKAEGRTLTIEIPEGASLEDARALFDEAAAALVAPDTHTEEPPAPALTAAAADLMLADLTLRDALSVSKG